MKGTTYDAYGKATVFTDKGADNTWFTSDDISANWSSKANPYQYTGQRYDPETGFYYYKNRYYDTDLGRFISRDPIGYRGGANLYTYVHNNPVDYIDLFGLAEVRQKPLSDFWWRQGSRLLVGRGHRSGEHWQIFYDDGTNSGYLRGKRSGPVFGQDSSSQLQYYHTTLYEGLDDNFMREAERITQEQWNEEFQQGGRRFRWGSNDCTTYVCDVMSKAFRT